jgi:hypothetical protein
MMYVPVEIHSSGSVVISTSEVKHAKFSLKAFVQVLYAGCSDSLYKYEHFVLKFYIILCLFSWEQRYVVVLVSFADN